MIQVIKHAMDARS